MAGRRVRAPPRPPGCGGIRRRLDFGRILDHGGPSTTARFSSSVSLIAAFASALGCTSGEDTSTSAPAVAAPARVTLTATDYAFAGPDTLAEGWTTFRLVNRGEQPHMAQLVRLEPGMTVEDFLGAYEEAFRTTGPRPEWARRLGGPGVAFPEGSTNATVLLEPGQHLWICLFNIPDGIPHVVGHGMAKPFVVEAATEGPTRNEPGADVVVELVEYAFRLGDSLRAGPQTIRVENPGSESHEISIVKLAPGKTIEDFLAWIEDPTDVPPLDERYPGGGVTSLAPGAEAYFDIYFMPGEYLLLCFVTAPDGRSHLEHGMIQHIRVG